jgi:hypothetical protein
MLVKLVKHCEVGWANIDMMQKVVMHGEESQVPGDLTQSEILIEQDFKI